MKNKYGIPEGDLDQIIVRDKKCVYCQAHMKKYGDKNWNYSNRATIEHLNHKADWDSVRSYVSENKPVSEIIAICCGVCNSSRSSKSLKGWFETVYCKQKNINYLTVSEVVKNYIDVYEN